MEPPQGPMRKKPQQESSENVTTSPDTSQIQVSSGHSIMEIQPLDSDAKSDASFDPLFDDEPDASEAQRVGDVVDLPLPNPSPHNTPQPRASSHIAPPKNAPPLLDPTTYANYSADLLMTASIDGQIILWDKRVNTPGQGVGRLWMSEKTPPWCLSVKGSYSRPKPLLTVSLGLV